MQPLSFDAPALIRKAYERRRGWDAQGMLDCSPRAAYRLVNAAGDGMPGLAIDVYARFAFVHLYAEAWRSTLPEIGQALLGVGVRGVYVADRAKKAPAGEKSSHLAGERPHGDAVIVEEDGLAYAVELGAGPATGLYLDQRENRGRLGKLVAGRSLLNTFSYTSSFSLSAARLGAATTNVDLSKAALRIAKQNFERNGLATENHRFVAEDVFAYLPRLRRRGERFYAVLLDPPTFARGKKGTFSTERDYAKLVEAAAPLVEAGGLLLAFANTHRMSEDAWRSTVKAGLGDQASQFRDIENWAAGIDFPSSGETYLKNVVLRRSPGPERPR